MSVLRGPVWGPAARRSGGTAPAAARGRLPAGCVRYRALPLYVMV